LRTVRVWFPLLKTLDKCSTLRMELLVMRDA
jgi:hypothetical protein